jgi:group I intron endonuclease
MRNSILEFPSTSGIYKITSPTGKVYVGEATNLYKRCSYYLTPNRVKGQRAIYNSLVKHGVDSHTIEVLELCSSEELLDKERYYQEYYCSVEKGLNCYLTPTLVKKKVLSLRTKELISLKSRGESNPFYGKRHSTESLDKISKASSGVNNPNFGSKFKSAEYLKKQSDSNSKIPVKLINSETQEMYEFKNSKEAALFCGVKPSNIRQCKSSGHRVKRLYYVV